MRPAGERDDCPFFDRPRRGPMRRPTLSTGLALVGTFMLVLLAGCSAAPSPPEATSCGGSHDWPPVGYEDPVPAGVLVEPAGPGAVRVRNTANQAWRFEVAVWSDSPCVGIIAETPIRSGPIEPGHEMETQYAAGTPPGPNAQHVRVGVAVFDPRCDATCTDAPIGFGWIDALLDRATSGASTRQSL